MTILSQIPLTHISLAATIVGVIIAALNMSKDYIVAAVRRPRLRILENEMVAHSSIGNFGGKESDELSCVLRIPVANPNDGWIRKVAAKNVEVFLTSIVRIDGGEYAAPVFLPIRLNWCHGGGAVCDRLACGAKRLLEFGVTGLANGPWLSTLHASISGFFGENVVGMKFSAEVSVAIPAGSYQLGLMITSDQATVEQVVRIHLKNKLPWYGEKPGDVVAILPQVSPPAR
ncbi:MAG: hypothetical protein EOP85_07130 [Verrucomicrobiaceae bacterium]|nr:MAG: hypothetical protein EOP85_07130 [Verrucomicrobiaceae bacterium]